MKLKLPLIAATFCLSYGVSAQNGRAVLKSGTSQSNNSTNAVNLTVPAHRTCATEAPGAEWDAWFNKKVEEFKAANPNGRTQMVNYTIPVIVHVIHGGQAVGTFPNISQSQINSQITVLNQDFAGTGFNNANVPAAFAAAKANTGISFCLAQKDPNGVTLAEPGIERISYVAKGWNNPAGAAYNTPTTFQNYVNSVIKPGSIWDPTRYMNIWITDENSNTGLLGYATFPAGTSLTGISSSLGTATTDGLWCWSASFGSSNISAGTYAAPYDKGRTASHEIGHWVGLRHIGGDGNGNPAGDCTATDYCADTPPQKGGFASGQYGQNYGGPTFPLHATGSLSCTAAAPNGDMFMNFMDYTDDAYMYMFTNDQTTRIQTAMSQGTYRSQLSASAATLCTISAATPTAGFSMPSTGCTNTAVVVNNTTNGTPAPTYVWASNPATGVTFSPNNTAANPTINFTTPGTYSISVVATNSLGSNAAGHSIAISACATASQSCNDTLTNVFNTDTLFIYSINSGTVHGYVGGNNTYQDKEKGEYFSSTGLVGTSQITGGIFIFYKDPNTGAGTKGSSTVVFKLYNGNNTSGPSGAPINTFTTTITNILASSTATNHVSYCSNPALQYNTNVMRPFSFNFPTPTTVTGDFIMSVSLPTTSGDTAAIFVSSEGNRTASTGWELQTPSTWVAFNDGTSTSWQLNASLAILPKISCLVTGINTNSVLDANVSIHPNPSNGIVNISTTLPNNQPLEISVHNSLGQLITTNKYTTTANNSISMDLSSYSGGVYFVTINNGQEKIVKRLILNK